VNDQRIGPKLAAVGNFLFAIVSTPTFGPTQYPIECASGAVSPRISSQDVYLSPPSIAESHGRWKLYLHSPNSCCITKLLENRRNKSDQF
jgi:hypothetical protein